MALMDFFKALFHWKIEATTTNDSDIWFFPRTTWYRLFMTDYVGILVSNRFWFPHTNTHARQIALEKKQQRRNLQITPNHTSLSSRQYILLLCFFFFYFIFVHCIIQFDLFTFDFITTILDFFFLYNYLDFVSRLSPNVFTIFVFIYNFEYVFSFWFEK